MRRLALALVPLLLLLLACDDEIGGPCAPDPQDVIDRLAPVDDENRIAKNVNFINCSQALCLSVQGSRGFCTIACESDAACPADFRCESPVLTGPIACGEERFAENGNSCQGVSPEDLAKFCSTDPATISARDE